MVFDMVDFCLVPHIHPEVNAGVGSILNIGSDAGGRLVHRDNDVEYVFKQTGTIDGDDLEVDWKDLSRGNIPRHIDKPFGLLGHEMFYVWAIDAVDRNTSPSGDITEHIVTTNGRTTLSEFGRRV